MITDITFDYISLSTLAKYSIQFGILKLYIMAGPQVNYNINSTIQTLFPDEFVKLLDRFNNPVIGISIAGGADLAGLINLPLLLEYRYEFDVSDNYPLKAIDIRNYSHIILIGLRIE